MQVKMSLVLLLVVGCTESNKSKPATTSAPAALLMVDKLPPMLRGVTRLQVGNVTGELEEPTNGYGGDYVSVALPAPPAQGASVKLLYPTPCGDKAIELTVPADAEVSGNRTTMRFPGDTAVPIATRVILDPELTEPVTIGSTTIAPQPKPNRDERSDPKEPIGPPDTVKVLDVRCAGAVTVGGTAVELPATKVPARTAKDVSAENVIFYADETIFLTHRADQCFLDRRVAYGDGTGSEQRLQGSRAYALIGESYSVWFEPVPETTTVVRRANEATGGTSLHALDVCPPQ